MPEAIRTGGPEVRFLQNEEDTGGSLDAFKMTVQPNARMMLTPGVLGSDKPKTSSLVTL